MDVREQLKLWKETQFHNPFKTEGFKEGIDRAAVICDDVISYREPLSPKGEDGCYCGRCSADLLEYIEQNIPFCPFCGQKIRYGINNNKALKKGE